MTEKQKRDKARAEAMLQAMRAQGPNSIDILNFGRKTGRETEPIPAQPDNPSRQMRG